jgi:siroheme synthase-like protein
VALSIAGRCCVVVGGGAVAARKVAALLESGATVRVISPALCPALADAVACGAVAVEQRAYQSGDLAGAFLAVAATNDRAVNAAVAAEARAAGALVTVCDDAAASDVVGMAMVRRGGLTVAIATDGASPALARLVREEIEALLTPEYAELLALVAAERRAVQATGQAVPAARWRAAVTPDLLALVRDGQRGVAATRLRAALSTEPAAEHAAGG